MGKLIVTEFVSLDGVMQAPGGEPGYAHSGWVGPLFSDELGAYKLDEQLGADILLLGRRTYESFYGAWPHRDGPMADKINTMPKYVASTTLTSLEWDTASLLDLPVVPAVEQLKARDDATILIAGSRTLVHHAARCRTRRPAQSAGLSGHLGKWLPGVPRRRRDDCR